MFKFLYIIYNTFLNVCIKLNIFLIFHFLSDKLKVLIKDSKNKTFAK